jgi:predicted amidohydrolase
VVPLVVATAQSLITPDIAENGRNIRVLMAEAKTAVARLVHFPEAALSGYAKAQINDWNAVDWAAIPGELEMICDLARALDLWVVLGCNHRLTQPNRPHNSLYVISSGGEIVTRYDKRLCSHTEITGWYSPGTEAVAFEVDGLRFGCALCIEVQFPELFAQKCPSGRRMHAALRLCRGPDICRPGAGPFCHQ